MPDLAFEVDSLDDFPETIPVADLYKESDDGKFRLVDINGLKPQSDFDRTMEALRKEREDHRVLRQRWKSLEKRDPNDIISALDEVEELRQRLESGEGEGGKLSDEELEALVEKRLVRVMRPKERELEQTARERDELRESLTTVRSDLDRNIITTAVNDLASKSCNPDAIADVRLAASVMLTRNEEGEIVTNDRSPDIAAGLPVDMWLQEMLEKRPTWNKVMVTGGGGSARGGSSGGGAGKNPFTHAGWDTDRQNALAREKGYDEWKKQAVAAGVDPNRPTRPPAPNGQA